jgi:rRNA-processing protein FCF1
VKLFVPSCAVRELRELAKDDKEFKAAASLARNFMRHKDNCPPEQANSECILKQLGVPSSTLC